MRCPAGPATVIARNSDVGELIAFVGGMEGQLTATVYASDVEVLEHQALLVALASRCGRLVFNGVPTRVEVCDAMVHGGPFPATYDGASTSVGLRAVERFTRLLAFQDCPARAFASRASGRQSHRHRPTDQWEVGARERINFPHTRRS